MDFLADLIAALARVELRARMGGGRRLGKKKKPKVATGRPAKMGPSAGCGTGSGGFKAGNNCAKEDGIPQRPLSQGGALKGANAKDDLARAKALREKAAAKKAAKEAADKAKSVATKPQREKQKKINKLRAEAARRKAEKGERDVAEKQAAAEAAAKKRAAMLQKIRIKKANEKLNVVEKPAGKYRGEVDASVKKSDGETQVSFAKRRVEEDLKTLHKELDAAEKRSENKRQEVFERIKRLEDEYKKASEDLKKMLNTKGQKPDQIKIAASSAEAVKSRLSSAYRERNSIDSDLAVENHDLVSEFVRSHGNGLSQFRAEDQFFDAAQLSRTSSKYAASFKENARSAWAFLSKVSAPIHQAKGSAVKVHLDTKGGDAEYIERTQVARHGVRGNGDHNTSAGTIVHEISHGLHYGPKPEATPLPKQGTLALPSAQQARDWIDSPAYRARLAIKEDYDSRVAALASNSPQGVEQIVYHKDRTNYRLWKPKGESRQRESYLGYSSQYADAENGNDTGATEVISMGVETLYRTPVQFRRNYRSHFDLTILFLAGRLH